MQATKKILCTIISISASTLPMASHSQEKSEQKTTEPSSYVHLNVKGKKIGLNPAQARCVMDKNTGLTWELKTTDNSIHNQEKDYRWGGIGAEKTGSGFFDDWNALITQSNKEKLCGFNDWRVPTIAELKSLVIANEQGLRINTQYFFDTKDSPYWSSSAYANYPEHAQTVHFSTGNSDYYNGYRGNRLPLRLVRGKSE